MLTIMTPVPANGASFTDLLTDFLSRRKPSPPHVHRCPRCYGVEACGLNCTVEPDLALDNGTPCGYFEVCPACARRERERIAGNAAILCRWADDGGQVPGQDPLADLIEPGDP